MAHCKKLYTEYFLWQGVKTFPKACIPLMGCPLCYTKLKEHVCVCEREVYPALSSTQAGFISSWDFQQDYWHARLIPSTTVNLA